MSNKDYQQENSKGFNWSAISGAFYKGCKTKGDGRLLEDKFKNLSDSSSSTSSDYDLDLRVSSRQQKLLSSAKEVSKTIESAKFRKELSHSPSGSAYQGRDWLKSARQRELVRTGSCSSLSKEVRDSSCKSALKRVWPSTANQKYRQGTAASTTRWWTESSYSRDCFERDFNRDSAGSLGKSGSGADLLVEAVRFGRTRHIKLLLDGGTDPDSLDHEGVSPLIAAVADVKDVALQQRLMKILLEAGANPNVGDCEGTTPLMHAAAVNCHDAAVVLLQDEKTDLGIQDGAGYSALMYAASNGYYNIVLLLLAAFKKIHHVAYIGQRNCKGLTATDLAKENGHFDVAALLKADVPFAAARPLGHPSALPYACDLERSPTLSDDSFGLSSEDYESSGLHSLNDQTFRPPTPASDFGEFASLSLEHQKDKYIDLTSASELSSSLGSGNEADIESLMDGDHLSMSEAEVESSLNPPLEMSSPAIGSAHSSVEVEHSTASSSVEFDSAGTIQHPMKIIVDRGTIEKLKEKTFPVAPSYSGGANNHGHHAVSHAQSLNPLKKVVAPAHYINVLGAEQQIPRIEYTTSNRSLNRAIKNLVHEDHEFRPGNRPPTPARPSLPNLLPGRHDFDSDNNSSSSSSDVQGGKTRRITVGVVPRATSDPQTLSVSPPQRTSQDEDESSHNILNASSKSEGWETLWAPRGKTSLTSSEGHVVPLPPIGQNRGFALAQNFKKMGKHTDSSVLSVAKKTLEKLDIVLAHDGNSKKKNRSFQKPRNVHHKKSKEI